MYSMEMNTPLEPICDYYYIVKLVLLVTFGSMKKWFYKTGNLLKEVKFV